MKEITASQIKGIQIGQAQDEANATGCTVILCKEGMSAGVDVRGGGPATRETDLLHPKNMVQQIHGVILSAVTINKPVSYQTARLETQEKSSQRVKKHTNGVLHTSWNIQMN